MVPHGGAGRNHTQTQTWIFTLTAADAGRYVFSFPLHWIQLQSQQRVHICLINHTYAIHSTCVYLSVSLVCTCVRVRARGLSVLWVCEGWSVMGVSTEFCEVYSSLSSTELSTLHCSHWRPACASSAVIAPVPRASCLPTQIRDITVLLVFKPSQTPTSRQARSVPNSCCLVILSLKKLYKSNVTSTPLVSSSLNNQG